LECKVKIEVVHLEAAYAMWDFCDRSAAHLFGQSTGDRTADAILSALKAKPEGLTRTEIFSVVFHRNKHSSDIARALELLAKFGMAVSRSVETEGRTAERWCAAF